MATEPPNTRRTDLVDHDTYGILVGWSHHEAAGKFDLRLETAQSTGRLVQGDVETLHVIMTRQQATVLANYLFQITAQTPPRRRGFLARWFGV